MRLANFSSIRLAFLALACAAASVDAQTPPATNPPVRALSLDDCVRMALEQNLNLQIERYNPVRMRLVLQGSYGVYDPVLSVSATQRKTSTQGRFRSDGTVADGTDNTANSVTPSLEGYLPWGLRYSADADFTHTRGSREGDPPFDDYVAAASVSLSQPLLKDFWIDSERRNIQVAKKDLKISEFGFEDLVRTVVRDVQIAYYELIYAYEDVRVQEKAHELAEALVAQNKEKVRVGVLAPLDEKQAESDAAARRADVLAAKRRVALTQNLLKNLITDRYESWYAVSIQPTEKLLAVPQPFDIVESWSDALIKRPDFKQVRLELEKQGIDVKYRYNQLFPALNVVGGYGASGIDSSRAGYTNLLVSPPILTPTYQGSFGPAIDKMTGREYPSYSFGAVLSLPLSRWSERQSYKLAKETLKQAELRFRQIQQTIMVEVDDSISQARIAFERVSATHEAALFAEAALDAEQKKLDNGKSTSFEVLRVQRDLTQARTDHIRALADYNDALSRLRAADGTILERAKISLEFK